MIIEDVAGAEEDNDTDDELVERTKEMVINDLNEYLWDYLYAG
jgi:hypothetical protein